MVGETGTDREKSSLQEGAAVTALTERGMGHSDKMGDLSLLELASPKSRRSLVSSLLVVLWVLLLMVAYFGQYVQSLCTLLGVPLLCTR